MFHLVTIFALVSCTFAGTLLNDFDGYIVNGKNTTIEQRPYQVSLQSNSRGHFCGGSIISEDTIVTAANCLQNRRASDFRVRLGTTEKNKGGEIVAVRAFRNHEGYNAETKVNDVAVIKLATPVRQSHKIRFINLAKHTPKTGSPGIVTGWGTKCYITCNTLPTILQQVEVDIVQEDDCASSEFKYGSQIKPSMVCAYAVKKGTCQGDSGGPLVSGSQLVGIVSWSNGCAWEGYPGVYTDVAYLRNWIIITANSL